MSVPRVPMYVSPERAEACRQLDILLEDNNYSPRARAEVIEYVLREGTPAGCPSLDREDEAYAELLYAEMLGLAPVPYDSPAWDRDTGVLFDAAMLADGTHPWPIPVVSADDDRSVPPDADPVSSEAPELAGLGLAPIAGGAEFEPSRADWDDYRSWCEEVDRRLAEHDERLGSDPEPRYGYE